MTDMPEHGGQMSLTVFIEDPDLYTAERMMKVIVPALREEFGEEFDSHFSHGVNLAISRRPFTDLIADIQHWTREPEETP